MFPLYDDVPSRRVPLATVAIIAMNGVVLLWSQGLPPVRQAALAYQWGFVPARIEQLVTHRRIAVQIGPDEQPPWPWGGMQRQVIFLEPHPAEIALTLVTCLFLHGGWMHLLGNMWFLWLFGDNVEDRLGHAGFLIFYLLGGLAASLTHWLVFPHSELPVIGASGAIAAVLGAYAITWPWAANSYAGVPRHFLHRHRSAGHVVLGGWFVYQIVAGLAGSRAEGVQAVAWWAHIGGFVAGILLMPVFDELLGEKQDAARLE